MRRFWVVPVLSLIAAWSACGGGSGSPQTSNPTLSSVAISAANSSLTAGQTQQLKASASYSNGSMQDVTASATWSSSDNTVATVATGGLLTARAAGQCSIVAKVGTVTGSFSVTVGRALVSIAVTPVTPSIAISTSQQFIATGTYSDNSTQNLTTQVTWASSNSAVAAISTTIPTMGLAKALSAGSTTVSATLGSISGSTSLTVTAATPTAINIQPQSPTLTLGLSQQFTATGTFSDGSTQDVTNVAQWHSSASGIASITVSGLATGLGVGSSNITAIFGGVTGGTSVTVNAANVNSIAITPANGTIPQGTQIAFKATGTFNDGSTHDVTHVVTWSSSAPTVLSVGSISGLGNGVAPGSVDITATLGSINASVPFNVSNATISSVIITPANPTIPTGARKTFTATGTFSDSSTQDVSNVVAWSSTDTAVAAVGTNSGNFGVATSVAPGTTNVRASFGYAGATASGSALLTVSSASLISISMSPNSTLLAPGSGIGIGATGTYSDGSTQLLNGLATWTSSDNSIATVTQNGFVTGQSAGIAVITAQSGPVSATANVVVEGASLTSVQVAPANPSVPQGFWTQFRAIGHFANGDIQDLTSFATWTSSRASIATISNAISSIAQAAGVQPGNTTISAVFAGQAGTATLTVTGATITAITLTPSSASITEGTTQAFTARGTFSDGSTLDVTNQVAWSSSTPAVATVSSRGLASGVTTGTTTISASVNGVTGMANLTVQ